MSATGGPPSRGQGPQSAGGHGQVLPGPGRVRRRDLLARRLHAEVDRMLAGLEAAADCAQAARNLQEEGLLPSQRLARFSSILESLARGLLTSFDDAFLSACRDQRFAPAEVEDLRAEIGERITSYFCVLLRAHGGSLLAGLAGDQAQRLLHEAERQLRSALQTEP